MKAIVKQNTGPGLELTDVPEPELGTNDVLIKIHKTAICGTDLHIYQWDNWAQNAISPPLIIGHEFVGEVADFGPGVTHYKKGDIVSGEGHITCGTCRNCLAGQRHLCHKTIGIGIHRAGAFAEFMVMPEGNVWPVHKDIEPEIASIFDPLGNAVHCALSFTMVAEDVLITGAGPIGCMAAAICKKIGARNVVVTDVNETRLNLAKSMGADKVINVKNETIEDSFPDLKIANGFDVGLEMSGNQNALQDMIRTMYHGGKIAVLGIFPEDTTVNWDDIIFKGLIIKGIYGREMFETWYKMAQLLRGGLDVSPVITHRFPAVDFEDAFKTIEDGDCGKVILEW
ncbi:MAG: L-threonine 3-dehydrogenase [Candidatus Marinimicrobia bacterium]|jgi:threonine 3-dehydrogenase|nr:L-threonine 3-dehydrogenase [Candidatus Neomarinimicrobiota bacterium]MBT3617925.1 L-threonine 3-dehydrogenase [Candidatus Neomarinimicrobiota bacterium]MBT3828762.1 L-threonine 3-dehydrogenase [Candidatus Neomarinimicrobiota bacterium]MBT3997053.1 L-threonine 3-dehydrogenase [Candidatus Neomarinimicrobiota bacterium]MBT4280809.1 L-threonine 3-dehydrogenase [Candidatus Neomarinimicrobiota bacterium]